MRIGLAKRAYERDPEAARRLLDEAQEHAEEALAELRHVVRGIHPPILTDRGLRGAVRALAASSGLDVTVQADDLDDGPRAPVAVESAAYFVVAEALDQRSQAQRRRRGPPSGSPAPVRACGWSSATRARAAPTTADGADAGGTGLPGMRRRVAALDGTFAVTSPAGGPTVIEAELPCAW